MQTVIFKHEQAEVVRMGEILHIQVGQCGNRIGNHFWKKISKEHGIDEQGLFVGDFADTQLERINVFYEESSDEVYVPRAVLVDLDSVTLNWTGEDGGGRPCGKDAFRPENLVGGSGGTGRNWARGYNAADGLPGRVLEAIRSEAERCDRLQGVQVVHSLGGGTGSGMGARIVDDARTELPNRTVSTVSVLPSPAVSEGVAAVEPYNAALCLSRLIGSGGGGRITYLADNQTLYDACAGITRSPEYADLNHLVSQTMSGVTTGLRFSGADDDELGADVKKRTANLVPYPKMHFFAPAHLPFTFRGQTDVPASTVPKIGEQLFAMVSARTTEPGRPLPVVMAAAVSFQNRIRWPEDATTSGEDPCKAVRRIAGAPGRRCWSPDSVKTATYAVPSLGPEASGTMVANSTAVGDLFDTVCRRSAFVLARKTCLHLYAEEGVSADDFLQARERMDGLIDEYRSVECAYDSGCTTGSYDDVDDADDSDDSDDEQPNSQQNLD